MAGQNISHEGHRQRMRARVEQYGLESLAPHEALEYLLYITNAAGIPTASPRAAGAVRQLCRCAGSQ